MNILELIERIKWIPSISVTFIDIVQMVIIASVLWYLAKTLYKTRAWILVKGLLVIGIIYLLICLTNMQVLQAIFQGLFGTLLIAIVIMLQPELQKIVELIGTKKFVDLKSLLLKRGEAATWYSEKTIYEITAACEIMSAEKTGALIALERGIPLQEYSNSGIKLGSAVSNQLLINIFEKNTPLHDGAVIVSNNKVESATCYLPLSMNYNIDKGLGTRHRAAIGISETTDCVVVVVSEETGAISLCVDGNIQHNINRSELSDALKKSMRKNEEKLIEIRRSKTPMWVKAFAPILSIIIWLSVVSANDPVVTKVIDDVPVATINTEVLDAAGHTYVVQSGHTVSVKVEGRRSLIDGMTKDDLCATADFSKLSIVYSIPIDVEPAEKYAEVEIVKIKSDTMTLAIESMVQMEIPVDVEIVGDSDNNYVVNVSDLETKVLKITCPQSVAKTLAKAVVAIDAYGKTNHFVSTVKPVVYDKNGDIVPEDSFTLNQDEIRVVVDIYTVKEVPIKIELTEQDFAGDSYYTLNNYATSAVTVRIAANELVMAQLIELNIVINPESYDHNASYMLVNLQTYLPEGAYLAKDQEQQIAVELDLAQFKKKTIELPRDKIQLTGYDASKQTVTIVDAPTSITLYYNTQIVDDDLITLDMLRPIVKIDHQNNGSYDGVITIKDMDGVTIVTNLEVEYTLETIEKETEE